MIKNQQKEKSEVVSHSPNISPLTLKPMQQNNNTPIAISIVIAGALIAVQQGSQIIRVHDVAETVDVIRVLQEVNSFTE